LSSERLRFVLVRITRDCAGGKPAIRVAQNRSNQTAAL
jgi:hypothetical protein